MRIAALTVLLCFVSSCTNSDSVDVVRSKNIEVVERFVYEVFGDGQLTVIDEIISPDYVGYWAGWGPTRGREELRQGIAEWRNAFPDWRGSIETIVAESDKVAIRLTSRGTFLGSLGEIEPNQKQVEIAEMAILRLDDGMIVEHWELTDAGSLERQLEIQVPGFGAIAAWQ